jgi:hypothetical protein
MQPLEPFGHRGVGQHANHGLGERAVEREVRLGNASSGREPALVGGVVATERADVVQGPRFAPHHPISGREVRVDRIPSLGFEYGLVEPGRQRIDQVDIARELAVLLFCDAAGHEDAEVTDALMHGVDDGLPVGSDFVDVVVQVEDPSERLLGRRDVVAFRAERHDR